MIVEDVVSTGGAILDATRELRDRGAEIHDVLCVIDRETGGTANLARENLALHAAFSMTEMLNAANWAASAS